MVSITGPVLVTGGAGYIGSAAVEQLIAAGESVVVFDNLSLAISQIGQRLMTLSAIIVLMP